MKLNLLSQKLLFLSVLIIIVGFLGFFLFQKTRKIEIYSQKNTQRENKEIEIIFNPYLLDWEEATLDASWSKRDSHSLIVFKDKIWLFGGIEVESYFNGNYWEHPHKNDIWVSENGKDWELITEEAPWEKRRSLVSIVFKDKIWILGGFEKKDFSKFGRTKNDVWYSEDGISWQEVTSSASWSSREGHTVVVFDNKIWVVGGVDFYKREVKNDVWYSEDGVNWVEATAAAGWSPRYDHTLTVFKDKMWLTGGVAFDEHAKNDIWVSENGKDWELATDDALWPGRHGHTSVVFRDKIWIISGWDTRENKGLQDAWYSENGYDWQKTLEDSLWIGREDHTSVVFDDKIWIMGGMDTDWKWNNDVWYSIYQINF